MGFMDYIIQWLANIRDYFLTAYYEVRGWVWPFYNLATPLYYLHYAFYYLVYYFTDFKNWMVLIAETISHFLSWESIKQLLLSWLTWLLDVGEWFGSWVLNVLSVIDQWWTAIQATIKEWINIAVAGLVELTNAWNDFWNSTFPQWTNTLESLRADVIDFFTNILPTLPVWSDISNWFNSQINDLSPLWEGWQDIRQEVFTFFQNPVEYIWNKFTDWFLGSE